VVSIVIPDNSVIDIINAGLTMRYYAKKDQKAEVHCVDPMKSDQFWSNIKDYIDKSDDTLLILDFPLPSKEILENIDLEPYEYSILNVPSELIAVTSEDREKLLEKGIVSMPQRSAYKCFPGEYIDKVERRWMSIGKKISFESMSESIDEETIKIAEGLLRTIGKDRDLAIDRVKENDVDFFCYASEPKAPKTLKHISKPDLELVFTSCSGFALFEIAFDHLLKCGKTPLGVMGDKKCVIMTMAPSFAHFWFERCDIIREAEIKFGRGAAIAASNIDDATMGMLIGRLAQRIIAIEFEQPKLAVRKTLMRRLVGGQGPKGRFYHGIKEKYPDLNVRKNIIDTPRDAFENVVDTLKETGARFRIVA